MNDFQARRSKDAASGWAHLVHLREVQLVQRRGILQLQALMRDQVFVFGLLLLLLLLFHGCGNSSFFSPLSIFFSSMR